MAHRHRLDLVVRDVQRRHLQRLLDARDLCPHLDAQLRVEVGERLVHQESLRLAHDRASHRDTLPLAARQLCRPALQHVLEPEHARDLLHAASLLLLRNLAHAQAEGEVVVDRLVRIERVVLEDHGDVAVARREVVDDPVADADLAVRDLLEPGDHPQRGRLAATGRPDQDHELALGDVEAEVAHGGHVVPVDLRQVDEPDLGHQDFTAPAVSPNAMRRWTRTKKRTTGSAQSVAPAISGPQSVPRSVVNDASQTISVCFSGLCRNT